MEKIGQLDRKTINSRLALCPSLPSLGSINQALQGLLQAEQRYSAHISEIVRRDPSLTSRLLRLVNSVYYGLATPVNSIEEAVFYLGVRQIRQLTTVTPIIEDFQKLSSQCAFPWRNFWQHCIGTAILTREVVSMVQSRPTNPITSPVWFTTWAKSSWPGRFPIIFPKSTARRNWASVIWSKSKMKCWGWITANSVRFISSATRLGTDGQGRPFPSLSRKAGDQQLIIAAVQIADLLMRNAQIGCSGNYVEVTHDACLQAPGWRILFPDLQDAEQAIARASLRRSLERLPHVLEGLV